MRIQLSCTSRGIGYNERACLPSFVALAHGVHRDSRADGRRAVGNPANQCRDGGFGCRLFFQGALTSLDMYMYMFLALAASAAAYVTAPPASLRRTEVLRPLDPLMVAGPCLIKVCVSLTPPHTQAAIHVNARRRSSVLVVAVAML